MPEVVNLPKETLDSMSIADIHSAYGETPPRYDFRVYSTAEIAQWLDDEIGDGSKTDVSERVTHNLCELLRSVMSPEELIAYWNKHTPLQQDWMSHIGDAVNAYESIKASNGRMPVPPQLHVKWIGCIYQRGTILTTVTTACYFQDFYKGLVEETEECVTAISEATVRAKYIMDAEAEEARKLEEESKAGLAALASLKDDLPALMAQAMQPMMVQVMQGQVAAAPNAATISAPVDAARYFLNSSGSTYHCVTCDKASTGSMKTLAQIAEAKPDAKPCSVCNPPALPVVAAAQ